MNRRKQLIIGGVILAVLLTLCITVPVIFVSRLNERANSTGQHALVSELAYCADNQSKPCVVSFGVDADGNMLANILLPDPSYPDFYLKITRNDGQNESRYECLRVGSSPNSVYCIGEKMPPGQALPLLLISTQNETILAKGDLSIIGLALPTIGVITSAPIDAPTESATSTVSPDFILPTFTPPPPSYPNP